MRDAVGGTFMMKVFLIFLATYIIFIAIALNYAKAFRVKNKIIDIIEQKEGFNNYDTSAEIGQVEDYIRRVHYSVSLEGIAGDNCPSSEFSYIHEGDGQIGAYCVGLSDTVTIDEITYQYYKVRTFVVIYIPVVEIRIPIPINGETRRVERLGTT